MTCGVHPCSLTPGQHSTEEISQRWPAVAGTVSYLTAPRFEPHTSHPDSNVATSELTGAVAGTVSDLTAPRFEPHTSHPDSNVATSELTGLGPVYVRDVFWVALKTF